MRSKLLICLLMLGFSVSAQTQDDLFIKDLIESIAENLPEDYDLSDLQDRLTYYRKHPININNTNAEELKTLVFLSPLQISNLFEHIKTNGKFIDVLELQSVNGFDLQTVQWLLPFVTLSQSDLYEKLNFNNLLKFGNNDLILRYGTVLERAKGYTNLPGSRYLGTKDRYLLRYRYTFANRVSAALIFEKDAGEYIFNGPKQYPFDFSSGHVALLNTGKFKKVVLGDYSLQFGQGLTLWSGFAFGKSPEITSAVKNDVGLRPYTSANEFSFMRGLATTLNIVKNVDLTAFYSQRKLDAAITLQNDVKTITSFNETGLHRTQNEIDNKNTTEQQVFGGVLQYKTQSFSVGAIALQTNLANEFAISALPYKKYAFVGKQLTNLGLHYNYTYKNFYFFGEIAKSIDGGFAHVNGLLASLSPSVSAVALYRDYQKNYHNFFNQATAEGTEALNEKGLYAGLNINPSKKWSFQIYGDYFKFPWLRFRVDAPSDGYELLAQANYIPTKKIKATLRFKTENKQQNTDLAVPINYLDHVKRENYRLEVKWPLTSKLILQNRLEVSQYKKGSADAEFGYLLYQDMAYSPINSKFNANVRLAYFNTPSYNSRIYAYEDDVLYNFTFGMYNGKGFRSYLNLKYKLRKQLDFWARYAVFCYSNVKTVGSGLDEINGKLKQEVRAQIRYQF